MSELNCCTTGHLCNAKSCISGWLCYVSVAAHLVAKLRCLRPVRVLLLGLGT